jgi:hypothetical protein
LGQAVLGLPITHGWEISSYFSSHFLLTPPL